MFEFPCKSGLEDCEVKLTAYCSDPLLHFFLDRWRLPSVFLPIAMGILITTLELAWVIPNDLLLTKWSIEPDYFYIFRPYCIVGMLSDPAYYLSTWVGGFSLWWYFAWLPGGIQEMLRKLVTNEVVTIKSESDQKKWQELLSQGQRQLGSPWLSATIFLVSVNCAVFIYLPTVGNLHGWAGESAYGKSLVTLWIIGLLYCVLQILIRQAVVTLLLTKIFRTFQCNIRPLHPDQSGGLAPLGSFSLKSTYLIAILGLIVVFSAFNRQYQTTGIFDGVLITPEIIAAGIAYAILAPLIFLAPLSTAHNAMKSAKDELLLNLSHAFETTYQSTQQALTMDGNLGLGRLKELQDLHTLTEKFPVWPFNTDTLRRFFASFLSPVVLTITTLILKKLID